MRAVCFAPYSAVWPHLEIEISHMSRLAKVNYETTFLKCDKDFNTFCNSMSAYGLKENSELSMKENICKICLHSTKTANDFFGINFEFLNKYLDTSDYVELSKFKKSITRQNWNFLEYEGIPIGKFAAYEIILRYKLKSIDVNPTIFEYISKQIEYNSLVVKSSINFFSKNNIEVSYVYNENYSLNKTFQEVAKKFDVRIESLQANGPLNSLYSRYAISNISIPFLEIHKGKEWENFSQTALSIFQILKICKSVLVYLSSKSFLIYSTKSKPIIFKSTLRKKYNIPKGKKILLITLASQYEYFAFNFINSDREFPIIEDTTKIINELNAFCVDNPEYYVILRIHPRELPNKRENVYSQEAQKLDSLMKNTRFPKNLIINKPEDNVSAYQLILLSDYVLNNLSTIGVEANIFGKPVISLQKNNYQFYPEVLNNYYDTSDISKLDPQLLVKENYSKQQNQIVVFRWLYFQYFHSTVSKNSNYSRVYFFLVRVLRRLHYRVEVNPNRGVYKFLTFMLSRPLFKFNSILIRMNSRNVLKLSLKKRSSYQKLLSAPVQIYLEKKLITIYCRVISRFLIIIRN